MLLIKRIATAAVLSMLASVAMAQTNLGNATTTASGTAAQKQFKPQDWTALTRTNYDGNGDSTNDLITWPGSTGTAAPSRKTILNVNTNTSGLTWSDKYQVWIVVANGLEDLDGDTTADDQIWMGDINGTRIWAGPLPGGSVRDAESVTLTGPQSDYVYILYEQASQDIQEIDIRELFRIALGAQPTAVKTWDIDAVDTTACINGSNGYEGMTFVPDRTQCTDYTTTNMPCGYFLLECQANAGTFYKFRLDSAAPVQLSDNVASAPCGYSDTTSDGAGLDTDWATGLIYETLGGTQDKLVVFDSAFNCVAVMTEPNAGSVDYEGVAIGPNGSVSFCDDAGGDCHVYQWPTTSPNMNNAPPLLTDTHVGLVVYGDATAATYDTGALVCAAVGKRCTTTYSPAGTNNACSNDYNTGSPAPFYAVCR